MLDFQFIGKETVIFSTGFHAYLSTLPRDFWSVWVNDAISAIDLCAAFCLQRHAIPGEVMLLAIPGGTMETIIVAHIQYLPRLTEGVTRRMTLYTGDECRTLFGDVLDPVSNPFKWFRRLDQEIDDE